MLCILPAFGQWKQFVAFNSPPACSHFLPIAAGPGSASWAVCSQRTAVDRHTHTPTIGVCMQGCVCAQFCEVFQSLPQGRSGRKGHPTPHQHPNNLNSDGQLSKCLSVTRTTLPAPYSTAQSAPLPTLGGMWDSQSRKVA